MPYTPPPFLDKVGKTVPIAAFFLSVGLMLSGFSSRTKITDKTTEDNTVEILKLKDKVEVQQRQIDQNIVLQDQLKALAEQNKETQQELHELTINLQSFESRFIVIPTKGR
jgi:hypothetical protein